MMTDRSLKRLNNGEIMAPMASDMVCPYSQSGQNGGKNATFMPTSRCATLGRVKNLEMTEYQRQKYVNGAAGSNIVSIFFQTKGGIMSEDTARFLLLQQKIFQISILSRKFKYTKHLIQIFCSG